MTCVCGWGGPGPCPCPGNPTCAPEHLAVTLPRNATNSGWRCPACGAGNAPWIAQCPCNSKEPKT